MQYAIIMMVVSVVTVTKDMKEMVHIVLVSVLFVSVLVFTSSLNGPKRNTLFK